MSWQSAEQLLQGHCSRLPAWRGSSIACPSAVTTGCPPHREDSESLFLFWQVKKLQSILKPMMLRRLKDDVEKNLAPKQETIIEVELTNIQKKYYRAILEKNFSFLSKGANQHNMPNLINTMMELRKCCNHPYLINGEGRAQAGWGGQISLSIFWSPPADLTQLGTQLRPSCHLLCCRCAFRPSTGCRDLPCCSHGKPSSPPVLLAGGHLRALGGSLCLGVFWHRTLSNIAAWLVLSRAGQALKKVWSHRVEGLREVSSHLP